MDFRILETHIEHISGYVKIYAALGTKEGCFKVLYDTNTGITEYAIKRVMDDGKLLKEDPARLLFPNLAYLGYDPTTSPGESDRTRQLDDLSNIYAEAEQCLNNITITVSHEQHLILRLQELFQLLRDWRTSEITL